MSHPSSQTQTLVGVLEGTMRLPKYQRDFAWDLGKMIQLWEDLKDQLFLGSQTIKKTEKYFLGAIVLDIQSEKKYLVDGQQRFTTMTLMCCAIRDALITTGHTELAYELNKNVIINSVDIDIENKRNKFELIDNPPDDDLSSEFRLSPYRKRLTNIPTGLITNFTKKGSDKIFIDIDKSDYLKWDTSIDESWEIGINVNGKLRKYKTQKGKQMNKLRYHANPPKFFTIENKVREDIIEGLEIYLTSNIIWPAGKDRPLSICDTTEEKNNLHKSDKCSLFNHTNREFYSYVRRDAEHLIRGYKKFYPTNGIKTTDKSTTLKIAKDKNSIIGELGSPSRYPKKGEIINFIEDIPDLGDWPTDREIMDIINQGESKTVEFKQSFKKMYEKRPSNVMKDQCTKAVAALLNTQGGWLFIGVSDNGICRGINDQWRNNDEAVLKISQYISGKIGTAGYSYVDLKIKNLDGENIVCVKVPKSKQLVSIKIPKYDNQGYKKEESARKEYYFRYPNESIPLKEKDIIHKKKELEDYDHASKEIRYEFKVKKSSQPKNILSQYPNFEGDVLSKEDIPSRAVCKIDYLEEGKSYPDWLHDESKRAKQIKKLVENTCFTVIEFNNNPISAINHFMMTNDSTRISPLNAYDLVSAFIQKLMRVPEGEKRNKEQRMIKSIWDKVSNDLYISARKDGNKINDFFTVWLLATLRTKTTTQRWQNKEAWEGVNKEFQKRTKENGEYLWPQMSDLFQEMGEYMVNYIRATDLNSKYWNEKPYCLAECRDEKTLLKIIKLTGVKQHLPVYLALVDAVEKNNADRKIIINFLKNLNYVWLRFNTIPKLMDLAIGFQPNEMYKQMLTDNKWLLAIKDADLTDKSVIKYIEQLPLKLIPETSTDYPWNLDHEDWQLMNSSGTAKAKQILHVLYSLERALEDNSNNQQPTMTRIHSLGAKPQVEHILPKNPKEWGGKWYKENEATKLHKDHVFCLGNHCLIEDSKNSAARNKIIKEKLIQYNGSDFKGVNEVKTLIKDSGIIWDIKQIKENSIMIMNSIVSFYDGKN